MECIWFLIHGIPGNLHHQVLLREWKRRTSLHTCFRKSCFLPERSLILEMLRAYKNLHLSAGKCCQSHGPFHNRCLLWPLHSLKFLLNSLHGLRILLHQLEAIYVEIIFDDNRRLWYRFLGLIFSITFHFRIYVQSNTDAQLGHCFDVRCLWGSHE